MAKNLQTVARRALTPCAGMDAFRFADGSTSRDLVDLRQALASKSSSLVNHHRAEYSRWVETVLGDPALARKMARVASKRTLAGEPFRAALLEVVDERLGKLRTRVI